MKVDACQIANPWLGLLGTLYARQLAQTLPVFAHGSGTSRLSQRNKRVTRVLNTRGIAIQLFGFPTSIHANDRRSLLDIPLLAEHLTDAVR